MTEHALIWPSIVSCKDVGLTAKFQNIEKQ